MKFRGHEENRKWILDSLETLAEFVGHDVDFRGDRPYHARAIGYQHRFLEDGKYRVVFLGTFNVGKSTAINAFLGGAYLPMDVEECTSKLTFMQRGERMQLLIALAQAVHDEELGSLKSAFGDVPANIEVEDEGRLLRVEYESDEPRHMCRSLEPLVTVLADEDYPHLAPLREKVEELNLLLASPALEEDIVIVDTPGVHSISEMRQEITYGIIEHSHLVLTLVDSVFAGNIHDLNFIKRIITHRGSRVFFVLNKADKLDSDDIDLRFARGPAWSLIQAFGRHGIPEDSEIFFLSGYRALRAQQLSQAQVPLEDVLADNRVSLPTSVTERIGDSEDPVRDLSGYLMGQSRLPYLRERLHEYLLNENKVGAVIETAAKFVWERSDSFLVPLQNEMKLAEDPSKFDELKANREELLAKLEEIRNESQEIVNRYDARSKGGWCGDEEHPGYVRQFRDALEENSITRFVIDPVLKWLREDGNLKSARRNAFKPLSAQIEHEVDEFISTVMHALHENVETNERETREAIAQRLGQVRSLRLHMTEACNLEAVMDLDTSMTRSYVAFGASGAVFGAAAGAVVGTAFLGIGSAIGAGLGGLLGFIGGFITRLAWSEEKWIGKLEPSIRENVMNMLVHGGEDAKGNPAPAVLTSVSEYLAKRMETFRTSVQEEVDNAIGTVQGECDDLLAREEQIREERDAIINRLQPKMETLEGMRERAVRVVAEALATKNAHL